MALPRRPFHMLALSALVVALTAGAARAPRHTKLVKSEPAANDTVAAAPKRLVLLYSERVDVKVSTFKLVGATGAAVALGSAKVDESQKGAPVVVPVTGAMARGKYVVTWSVASDDGHAVKGTFGFVVK
jgi:methionine-rich copper-binding protein CopC